MRDLIRCLFGLEFGLLCLLQYLEVLIQVIGEIGRKEKLNKLKSF